MHAKWNKVNEIINQSFRNKIWPHPPSQHTHTHTQSPRNYFCKTNYSLPKELFLHNKLMCLIGETWFSTFWSFCLQNEIVRSWKVHHGKIANSANEFECMKLRVPVKGISGASDVEFSQNHGTYLPVSWNFQDKS